MTTRSRAGRNFTIAGLVVGLGPIAIFFFMAAFPSLFDNNTIGFWHYLSAFGMILFVPTGIVLCAIGEYLRLNSKRRETAASED